MAGLSDLEVARIVQESFFPSEELIINGWSIYGRCVPAIQVSGDYYDYYAIDDTRAIIILGDVSGHGVSAALVVAMAKALIAHEETPDCPVQIITILSKVFLTLLKRKKMMSCVAVLFDTKNMSISVVNAGQCYPIRCENDQGEFIEAKGILLGMKARKPIAAMNIPVRDGEAFVFYTDGLVEAMDETGHPIGYSRLLETLPKLIRYDAVQSQVGIRNWVLEKSPKDPPEDDTTILIWQKVRNPS